MNAEQSTEKVGNVSDPMEHTSSIDLENLPQCDPIAEKKLVHKFDRRLMSLFCLAYFFAALDRTNIGNAKVAGMNASIGLTAQQYSNAVSIIYSTYLPTTLPGVWLYRQFKRPRHFIGGLVIMWSIASLCHMFVNSYGQLVACRVLLGFFEGPYFSCMSLTLSDYYLPHEFARRVSFFFASSALSGAFGGLIATGITRIHSGSLESWRYLFLIEGLISFLVGVVVFILLPDSPRQLATTEEERLVLENRTARRKHIEGSHKFDLKEFISAINFKVVCSMLIQFCQNISLYGFSVFLPSILNSLLGYDRLKSQYLTVPVYIFAAICSICFAEVSDRSRMRGPLIIFTNLFGIAAYAVLGSVKTAGILYFALYLICFSLYVAPALNESWIANNNAPTFKRGCVIGITLTFANSAGAIAPQVYNSPPNYKFGTDFTLGCLCIASVTAGGLSFYFFRKNRINQRILESGVDHRKKSRTIGDDSPEFRFMI